MTLSRHLGLFGTMMMDAVALICCGSSLWNMTSYGGVHWDQEPSVYMVQSCRICIGMLLIISCHLLGGRAPIFALEFEILRGRVCLCAEIILLSGPAWVAISAERMTRVHSSSGKSMSYGTLMEVADPYAYDSG